MTKVDKERQQEIDNLVKDIETHQDTSIVISNEDRNYELYKFVKTKHEHQLAFNKRWMEWLKEEIDMYITLDESGTIDGDKMNYSNYILCQDSSDRLEQSRKDLIKLEGWKYVE